MTNIPENLQATCWKPSDTRGAIIRIVKSEDPSPAAIDHAILLTRLYLQHYPHDRADNGFLAELRPWLIQRKLLEATWVEDLQARVRSLNTALEEQRLARATAEARVAVLELDLQRRKCVRFPDHMPTDTTVQVWTRGVWGSYVWLTRDAGSLREGEYWRIHDDSPPPGWAAGYGLIEELDE